MVRYATEASTGGLFGRSALGLSRGSDAAWRELECTEGFGVWQPSPVCGERAVPPQAKGKLKSLGLDAPSASSAAKASHQIEDTAIAEVLIDHQRLSRELKLAEQVQHRLLPRDLPEVPGYEFFAFYQAAYEIGGDYYDFVPLPNNRLGIVLGDVSGKGIAAALVMAKFSGDTRHTLQAEGSPAAAAQVLNNTLCETGIDERFITLSLAILDTRAGRLQLCSAGHPSLLLRRASGVVQEVGKEITCFPLGIVPNAQYNHVEVTIRPGDVMVIYSDGVTDSRNHMGELYDTQENRRLLKRVQGTTGGPKAIGQAILEEIHDFSRGQAQADDLTLVCFGPTASPK